MTTTAGATTTSAGAAITATGTEMTALGQGGPPSPKSLGPIEKDGCHWPVGPRIFAPIFWSKKASKCGFPQNTTKISLAPTALAHIIN